LPRRKKKSVNHKKQRVSKKNVSKVVGANKLTQKNWLEGNKWGTAGGGQILGRTERNPPNPPQSTGRAKKGSRFGASWGGPHTAKKFFGGWGKTGGGGGGGKKMKRSV